MKPLCFVLMPFGRKSDATGRIIDFDAIYERIIAAALRQAGLDVIRADEEQVGGSIHKPMFERLILCEYAVADLTTANPNVYYELGVRHALRPRSTVILFAEGTQLPFDVAPLRGMNYRLDDAGRPSEPERAAAAIATRLNAVRLDQIDDSPIFQLIDHLPRIEVDHQRTDVFRERAEYSRKFKDRLAIARRTDKAAVLAVEADPQLANLGEVESGIIVDLFLSMRDVKAHDEMLALYERMPRHLQRARMVQEQRGFALNRVGRRDEAIDVLKAVIKDFGISSETNGLLGRVYKDRMDEAVAAGDGRRARGQRDLAVAAYLAGFEADWRDAFPGVNALTLMELGEEPDPRQAQIAPVVLYAASRKAGGSSADYWDHATLVEVAVLKRDESAADRALSNALSVPGIKGWMAETTMRNLRLIREKRAAAGEDVRCITELEADLKKCVDTAPAS